MGRLPEGLQRRRVEEHEANARDFRARGGHGSDRYGRRLFDRIAVDAGRDGRKRDRPRSELIGHSEGFDVARPQQLLCLGNAVDGPNGVDHPPGREMARTRRDRLSRGQAVTGEVGDDAPTLLEDRGPPGSVDRSIDATATCKCAVGRVHDRVDSFLGDVTLDQLYPRQGLDP